MEEENLDNKDLIRWIKGEMTKQENDQFEAQERLDDLKFVLDDVSNWSLPSMDIDAGLEDLKNKKESENKTKVIPLLRVLQYAAALILPFAIYYGFSLFNSKTVTIIADGNSQLSHYLPDSSLVVLNPNSSISYHSGKYKTSRSLDLNGEAYFDVREGENFDVISTTGTVEVLGTQFQIKDLDHLFRVNCFNGKVKVKVNEDSAVLLASQGIEYRKGDEHLSAIKMVNYHWEKGYFSYSAISLKDIVGDLNNSYNVEIVLPPQYQDLKFSGKISMRSLNDALEGLFTTMQIPYTLNSDNTVTFR